VVAVTILTEQQARAALVVAVKAHNTHLGLMLLAVQLTPVAVEAVAVVEAVAQAAVDQVYLFCVISAHNA
jgi:hypothetical protein